MEKMYAAFNEWRETFSANIVNLGGALSPTGRVVNSETTIDGPFVESKEIVGGYMIISAENYEEAVEVARACPGVCSPGSCVEIREISTP